MRYLYNNYLEGDALCQKIEDYQFFDNNRWDKETIERLLKRENHNHTVELANIIQEDMLRFSNRLSTKQQDNLDKLKEGHKVVIAGQQAGLFLSPAYILHKIVSILIVTDDIKNTCDYDAVPVFWVAGEDHDYDEVNHTHVYDSYHKRVKKVSYKPNLELSMSIGFYEYDKKAMHHALDELFNYTHDSERNVNLKTRIEQQIDYHKSWTDLFSALVNDVFSEYGLIIFNSHNKKVRQLETQIFKEMILKSDDIDNTFRVGQEKFNRHFNIDKIISTKTNAHLFINSKENRELLSREGDTFKTDTKDYTKEELLQLLEKDPEQFSNNVVTRPLMQELLFNTVVFLGGGAEVKYWGELHEVFRLFEREMPIVLRRMSFININTSMENIMDDYHLKFTSELSKDIEKEKEKIIKEQQNEKLIKHFEHTRKMIQKEYESLQNQTRESFEKELIDRNHTVQLKQLDYLERKYNYESKRKIRRELSKLNELKMLLLPNDVLQERVYNHLVFKNELWDFSPLCYHDELVVIKD